MVELRVGHFGGAVVLLISLALSASASGKYQPTWESLDTRPLPAWYDEAKFGIFLHWGVYSVPAYCGAWMWWQWKVNKEPKCVEFMKKNYPPDFAYADFAPQFKAEMYDPKKWAELFAAAGAKYVVLTSKHHEGFTLYPSKYSFNWNSMDVGPKRDLVGELASAIRNYTDIKFGLYHSLLEWLNPLFEQDQKNKYQTRIFPQTKTMPELYELVKEYKPDVVWSDGGWQGSCSYWQSKEFIAWLYNDSPVKDTVVTNDRWGSDDVMCHHGDFYTCHDNYNPGKLLQHKWERCMTVDTHNWAYQRDTVLSMILSTEQLVKLLVETVSCGGNLLMDVGPTSDGRITPIFEERLREMGKWLQINGEGIYKSRPWLYQNDTVTSEVWYTSRKTATNGTAVYAFVFNWPKNNELELGAPTPTSKTTVQLLGFKPDIDWTQRTDGGIVINLPVIPFYQIPSQFVCTFKILYLK